MIVVKARTIEEWKSIQDIFFKKGYHWNYKGSKYNTTFFKRGRQLLFEDDKTINWSTRGMFNQEFTYDDIVREELS